MLWPVLLFDEIMSMVASSLFLLDPEAVLLALFSDLCSVIVVHEEGIGYWVC